MPPIRHLEFFRVSWFGYEFSPRWFLPETRSVARRGWTAPRKASWEIRARFLIHARTVVK